MELKLSKKIANSIPRRKKQASKGRLEPLSFSVKKYFSKPTAVEKDSPWNYIFVFLLFFVLFVIILSNLTTLQIVKGKEMLDKSNSNQVRIKTETAYRGVIFDRNGNKLAENVPSMNLYIKMEEYLDDKGVIKAELLESTANTLGGIIGDAWKKTFPGGEYGSILEKVYSVHKESPYFVDILIAENISNEKAIEIKSKSESLPGIYIDNDNQRYYPYKDIISHIIGYTGDVTREDLSSSESLSLTDTIGKSGVERWYDKQLRGENGEIAIEVDALGRSVSNQEYIIKEAVSGDSLYLTIDIDIQKKFYNFLKDGVKKANAIGGAGIIEDVETGEIIAMVTYPSYDNNLFVGGISTKNYSKLLKDKNLPLINRAISVQMPPGSTFKSLVAPAALDAGAITKNTIYVSRYGYKFSNGAPFQEFQNHAYGALNVVGGIAQSSNIFFCELIRNWDINKLDPYLEKFGIGKYTGIDIPGEAPGRLPSPANKKLLAETTSPWLEPVWYPEGDSCNSVIGQGITLVTPIQMSNWMAALATEGKLHTPHVAKSFRDEQGEIETLTFDLLEENMVSKEAFNITKEGMWSAVNGPKRSVGQLANVGVVVAAKTGTAEFGKVNSKGIYEHTHAWVGGFFPYDKPKYSFSVFLEDGGHSSNAVAIMQNMIMWMVKEGKI